MSIVFPVEISGDRRCPAVGQLQAETAGLFREDGGEGEGRQWRINRNEQLGAKSDHKYAVSIPGLFGMTDHPVRQTGIIT